MVIVRIGGVNFSSVTSVMYVELMQKQKSYSSTYFYSGSRYGQMFAAIKKVLHITKIKSTQTLLLNAFWNSKSKLFGFEMIQGVLAELKIDCLLLQLTPSQLRDLPLSSIAYLTKLDEPQVITIVAINEEYLTVVDPDFGYVQLPFKQFIDQWDGVVVAIATYSYSIQENYRKKKIAEESALNDFKDSVRIIPDVLTKKECEHFMEIARPLFERSVVGGDRKKQSVVRISDSAILKTSFDPSIERFYSIASQLIGEVPFDHIEILQCHRYGVGNQYKLIWIPFVPKKINGCWLLVANGNIA